MPGTGGATDKVQRTRRGKTDRGKSATKDKKKKDKKKKEKEKKQNAAKSAFLTPVPHDAPVPDPLPPCENDKPGSEADVAVDEDDIPCEELHAPVFMGVVPDEEIIAKLDAKEREDDCHTEGDEDADFDDPSVMKICMRVHHQ